MKEIKIKYFSEDYPRLKKLEQGDWIDLRVNSIIEAKADRPYTEKELAVPNGFFEMGRITYKKGDILFLGLGVAMELPNGYEAHILPRSSMFKNTGFVLTNGVGIIDNSYSGNDDEWKAMVYCTRDGIINRHDRLFQFRIIEKQPEIDFKEVDQLEGKNRGGYGSTGIK